MTAALNPGRPFTGSERQLLENTLDLNRSELVRAVENLSDTEAREKQVPSLTGTCLKLFNSWSGELGGDEVERGRVDSGTRAKARPQSRAGKVLKRELRKQFAEQSASAIQ